MVLGYITLATLFIVAIPLLIYADELHSEKNHILLRLTAIGTGIVAAAALLCQIFGIAELREILTVCHIMLIIDFLALAVSSFIFKAVRTAILIQAPLF